MELIYDVTVEVQRSSAIAEGLRDALVSTNPADTRRRHIGAYRA